MLSFGVLAKNWTEKLTVTNFKMTAFFVRFQFSQKKTLIFLAFQQLWSWYSCGWWNYSCWRVPLRKDNNITTKNASKMQIKWLAFYNSKSHQTGITYRRPLYLWRWWVTKPVVTGLATCNFRFSKTWREHIRESLKLHRNSCLKRAKWVLKRTISKSTKMFLCVTSFMPWVIMALGKLPARN